MGSNDGNLDTKASSRFCCKDVCPSKGSSPNFESSCSLPPVAWKDDTASDAVGTRDVSIAAALLQLAALWFGIPRPTIVQDIRTVKTLYNYT